MIWSSLWTNFEALVFVKLQRYCSSIESLWLTSLCLLLHSEKKAALRSGFPRVGRSPTGRWNKPDTAHTSCENVRTYQLNIIRSLRDAYNILSYNCNALDLENDYFSYHSFIARFISRMTSFAFHFISYIRWSELSREQPNFATWPSRVVLPVNCDAPRMCNVFQTNVGLRTLGILGSNSTHVNEGGIKATCHFRHLKVFKSTHACQHVTT